MGGYDKHPLGGGSKAKVPSLGGRGIDIFWNHTFLVAYKLKWRLGKLSLNSVISEACHSM